MEKNLWNTTRSLLVVLNYENLEKLNAFRKSLEKFISSSEIKHYIILVNIEKNIDKNTLPPNFSIYYHSPNDYNFWGKLKDVQLETELKKSFDTLLWIGETNGKSFNEIKQVLTRRKIGVNNNEVFFDLNFNPESDEPLELLTFVVETLKKITLA